MTSVQGRTGSPDIVDRVFEEQPKALRRRARRQEDRA